MATFLGLLLATLIACAFSQPQLSERTRALLQQRARTYSRPVVIRLPEEHQRTPPPIRIRRPQSFSRPQATLAPLQPARAQPAQPRPVPQRPVASPAPVVPQAFPPFAPAVQALPPERFVLPPSAKKVEKTPFTQSAGAFQPQQPPPAAIPATAAAAAAPSLAELAKYTPQLKEILTLTGLGGDRTYQKSGLPNIASVIPSFGGGSGLSLPPATSGGLFGSGQSPIYSGGQSPISAAAFQQQGAGGFQNPVPPNFGSFAGLAPFAGGTPGASFLGGPPPELGGATPNNGFLGLLATLARQITSGSGIRNIISRATSAGAGQTPTVGVPGRPPVAGIPNIPGLIPLLPGGIPRNANGQIDVLSLIGAVSQRFTNGTTLADVFPADRLEKFSNNLTEALLPQTPEVDLTKLMGRWFEGINSPRASDQRCIVHHYGGLTQNGKTATFSALKIYREGSEFGQVRYSIGYAFRGGHRSGMLQMHASEETDAMPYWIYLVGPEGKDPFGNPQYEYAVVSNWVKYPVMVLVRDPDSFKSTYEVEVLRWLEQQGFINAFVRAFNLLQPVSYENCQYADSTFEVFG